MPVSGLFDTSRIPAQRRFMESTTRELLFSGAFGASKTRVGLEKGLFLSLKYPGNFGVVLRRFYSNLRNTTQLVFFRDVCPPDIVTNFNQVTGLCQLINNSQILFTGIDDAQKVASLEAGWIFVDEAIELDELDYMMLLGRLRLAIVPFRQIFLATNPGVPTHFLFRRFFQEPSSDREVVESNTLQNPYLPPDYIKSLEAFTGIYRQRYVEGKWVGFEGLVYPNFDSRKVIVAPFDIPSDWLRYRSIDFGFGNPMCVQWWAKHPEVNATDSGSCVCPAPVHHGFYLYREIYMTQRNLLSHITDIKRFPEPIVTSFADWAAGDRALLESAGIPTRPAIKDIIPGIQTVLQALSQDEIHILATSLLELDESLLRAKRPTRTAEEFPSYSWAKTPASKNVKELPSDANNHGMDALRYLFHTLTTTSSINTQIHYGTRTPAIPVMARNWAPSHINWRTLGG